LIHAELLNERFDAFVDGFGEIDDDRRPDRVVSKNRMLWFANIRFADIGLIFIAI